MERHSLGSGNQVLSSAFIWSRPEVLRHQQVAQALRKLPDLIVSRRGQVRGWSYAAAAAVPLLLLIIILLTIATHQALALNSLLTSPETTLRPSKLSTHLSSILSMRKTEAQRGVMTSQDLDLAGE